MEEIALMPLSIFQTVEFYVVMVFLAAAVVGLAAMPSRRQLIAGELLSGATPSEPGIVAIVNDDGSMTIYRFGLENMCESGAYSLAVTFIGYDVTIDERLVYGRHGGIETNSAQATVTGLAPERYHIHYRSEATGRSAAFTLNMRPGNRIDRKLT